ncbi:hypothetical protein pCPXV0050 [Cowpox virus]|uniref:Uncharacterized protein n=1 Tax=Cowpox virus TaxID=10243 RepID=A0A212PXT0_COWPX|nr:hypothetical protein pCPXV0050 [Cowpox virus]SPN68870.1 hypothetical protein pCPXV0050 [Cowpox virus]
MSVISNPSKYKQSNTNKHMLEFLYSFFLCIPKLPNGSGTLCSSTRTISESNMIDVAFLNALGMYSLR